MVSVANDVGKKMSSWRRTYFALETFVQYAKIAARRQLSSWFLYDEEYIVTETVLDYMLMPGTNLYDVEFLLWYPVFNAIARLGLNSKVADVDKEQFGTSQRGNNLTTGLYKSSFEFVHVTGLYRKRLGTTGETRSYHQKRASYTF